VGIAPTEDRRLFTAHNGVIQSPTDAYRGFFDASARTGKKPQRLKVRAASFDARKVRKSLAAAGCRAARATAPA
jgi:hypothetical protein